MQEKATDEAMMTPLARRSSSLRIAVVICTKDRPGDLDDCLQAVQRVRSDATVIVIDASDDRDSEQVCRKFQSSSSLVLQYVIATQPGLTRQRNQSIGLLKEMDIDLVHFLDDDTEVLPGYFDAIESCFDDDTVAGAGGIILNQNIGRWHGAKRLFFLWGKRGKVLPSGRIVIGQDLESPPLALVDWLDGASMSYRVAVFDEHRFDDRLRGWSWGEDFDFGFRVSRNAHLMVTADARCIHHLSPLNRHSAERLGFETTLLLYVWVREQQQAGMSPVLFWWATFGELLMRYLHGIVWKEVDELAQARGVARGVREILRGKATRTLGE